MQKVLALFLSIALLLCLFSGCDSKGSREPSMAEMLSTIVPTAEVTTTEMPTETESHTPTPNQMKIAMIAQGLFEEVYNYTTWQGVKNYALSNDVPYAYYKPTEDSDEARMECIDTAVSEGADVIVCPGPIFEIAVYEAQQSYPDVQFLLLDGEPHTDDFATYETMANTMCIQYREEQAGYLAGYAAVKEGYRSLGFTADMMLLPILDYMSGFLQGINDAAIELDVVEEIDVKSWFYNCLCNEESVKSKFEGWLKDGTEIVFVSGPDYLFFSELAIPYDAVIIGSETPNQTWSYNMLSSVAKFHNAAVEQALAELFVNGGKWPRGGETIYVGAAENCVGLIDQEEAWIFKNFTVEEYEAVYAELAAGNILVSDYTETPELLISVDYGT